MLFKRPIDTSRKKRRNFTNILFVLKKKKIIQVWKNMSTFSGELLL